MEATLYAKICHFQPSPAATPGVVRPVKMHNDFQIGIVVRREALNTTLSGEATPDNAEIVLFYSCTRDKV
ncbi:hypothetical protein D6D27_01297 [Aureobasidium pullulans]|nr:hypothetical protein D6D27_01297 [Aureobasidium pullulans]